MEIFEKLFQKIWDKNKQSKNFPGMVKLENMQRVFSIFASGILKNSFEPQISSSPTFVGFQGLVLYLPQEISISSQKNTNLNIYLNLILQSCAIKNLNLFRESQNVSEFQQRLLTLQKISLINRSLDQEYPQYFQFQGSVINEIHKQVKPSELFKILFQEWVQLSLLREELQLENIIDKFKTIKKNETLPDFLLLTIPCLPSPVNFLVKEGFYPQKSDRSMSRPQTELEKPHSSPPQLVDLEKEKVNPVVHSFEKMNTADEYEGGRRIDSGDDELQDHARALEELDLSKVTRGGESVQSIYRSEAFNLFESQVEDLTKSRTLSFLYPEWSILSAKYLKDFCQLYETEYQQQTRPTEYLNKIKKDQSFQIAIWKKKIQALVNEPLWMTRQKDGDEIDLDSFVREYVQLQQKLQVSGRWYIQRKQRIQQLSVSILFDQSMSADSWVKNRRIIDVITEAISVIGLLTEEFISEIEIAGTWSATRHSCHFQYYKKKKDPWSKFWNIADQIEPQGYTRLGPAIRHATVALLKSTAPKKLLLLITDGRPTDLDGYEGTYGVQDVKQACLEAQNFGILLFAMAIEKESKQHFSKMFKHYKVLSNPDRMSEELFKILTKLIIGKSR